MGPWRAVVLAVVALTGTGATVATWNQAQHDADDRQRALATEVAGLVEGTADSSVAAVAGAGGLVSMQGDINLDAFRTYAREVVDLSPIETLAYVPVVSDDDRARFEARLGQPIIDRRNGALVTAPERPLYYPVLVTVPETEDTQTVLGFDILADPVRGTAAVDARDTGRTVLTEPVRATSNGAVSFFLVKPLYRTGTSLDSQAQRRDAHVGFITTVYAGANFTEAVLDSLPPGSRFTLYDGDVLLAASDQRPSGGTPRELDADGRAWELVIEDGRGVDRSLAWALAAFTALLMGGLILFLRRAEAHDQSTRRAARVIGRTADVAQALAAAGTVEEVEEVIQSHLPAVLGATVVSLGIVDRDHDVLHLGASPVLSAEVSARYSEIPLTTPVPITEVVRTGEPLLLRTHDDWRAHAPAEVVDDVVRSGIVSTVCLPLEDRYGQVAATLAMSWDREVDFDAPARDTIRTITELCEYTLDRARSTDEAARRATQLALLAAQLAAALTLSEVLDIITESASSPVEASATSVGLVDREAGVLRTHHGASVAEEVRLRFADPPLDAPLAFTDAARTGLLVLLEDHATFAERYPESASSTAGLGFGARAALPMRDSQGRVVGAIVHAWAGPRVFHEALMSTLLTIADLAGLALERTALSEAEHRLVTTLQDSLLVPLPEAAHLDIAACYLPAAHHIGMGGDWYEGIALDEHRYALIVGDVAGHGITAVGDMAQLRAVIGALVRLGTPIDEVFARTTALLQAAAHNPTASALLVVIDTETATLSYATAGHPPPLVRRPSGASEVLDDGRQPILGIPIEKGTASEAPFPPGSVLVAYTDGLIERRGEAIDLSMKRLRGFLDAASDTRAQPLADELLRTNLAGREPDDDVALVVIGHRPA